MDIKNLFQLASQKGASDIHLMAGRPPFFRINGQLTDINALTTDGGFSGLSAPDLESFLDQLANREQKIRFLDKRDLDLGYPGGRLSVSGQSII
jgi:twitching motility protein PilT